MGMLDKGPLPEIYNAIYSVEGHLKLNQCGYTETLFSDFGTKIWAMTVNWENLLTPGRKEKQLITCFKIHHLTGRKDAILMLHKLNVCPAYNDIRLQNKSWARMVASESVLANTC